MKTKFITTIFVILLTILTPLNGSTDKDIFSQAKISLFDKKWDQALSILNDLISKYPESKYTVLAYFYRGRCLVEKKLPEQALQDYSQFIETSGNENLIEEATISIIDISYKLLQEGKKPYQNALLKFLNSNKTTIRYYAAFKISYIKNKNISKMAVPVLREMMESEEDPDLQDRAKIALMRIDPQYLESLSKKQKSKAKFFKIQAFEKESKKVTLSLTIPLDLAMLALESLPDDAKSSLANKGYRLDRIMENIINSGEFIKIEDENQIFKIWIE